ncbi:MAG: hypothetical protein IJH04_03670 [Eggerthellaceae bacterium]|nr:hypothetical protein [Eggerthellaceae bacterium]
MRIDMRYTPENLRSTIVGYATIVLGTTCFILLLCLVVTAVRLLYGVGQ